MVKRTTKALETFDRSTTKGIYLDESKNERDKVPT